MNESSQREKESVPLVLKNGIFVAGHPRSGTSLACQLLEGAGINFPQDFPADEYNKKGYFELAGAKELEKKLLDHAMTEVNIEEMNRIVETLNNVDSLAGLKIVHIPALFFYRHISRNIRVVFIYRHPADVRASMLRRGISQFRLSWFENNNALIAAYENIPKSIVISYESVMAGKKHIRTGFQKLGFKVDPALAKREEQTQKNSRIVIGTEEMRLYKRLQRLERESCR